MIHDHHGQPKDVVGFWSEVTARKTAEQAALAASEQRLTDAIESISEGFSLYDAQDRLVLGNYKYKELFDHGEGPPEPGATYEDILRNAVESGLIQDARRNRETWIAGRLAQDRNPGEPVLEHRADGSWIQVSERRTENAGRVTAYSDLTELKESEQRAAAANQPILKPCPSASTLQLTGLKRQNPVIVRRGLPANVLRPWLPEATNGARRENPSIVLWGVAK